MFVRTDERFHVIGKQAKDLGQPLGSFACLGTGQVMPVFPTPLWGEGRED